MENWLIDWEKVESVLLREDLLKVKVTVERSLTILSLVQSRISKLNANSQGEHLNKIYRFMVSEALRIHISVS